MAIVYPRLGEPFHPFLIYFMMLVLFVSFLRIDFEPLFSISKRWVFKLIFIIFMKLIVLPIIVFFVFSVLFPPFALPALLLTGISTGVVAPFIATLVNANTVLVFQMVTLTSIAAPFTLPFLVKLLVGADLSISVVDMLTLLTKVIFIPLIAVLLVRRLYPILLDKLLRIQYSASLTLFAIINLGVFAKYSQFFKHNLTDILTCLLVACVLAILYYAVGFILLPRQNLSNRFAAGVSLAAVNNVLVIMFSSQFFGPLAPMLAAMYMFPYYLMIPPIKLFRSYLEKRNVGS